ncbi:MAG: SurA N-terminal domain-containing protein [Pseudomonadota bacterium]
MLTAIRERATGWIAWTLVILITIPFALWGINSYFEGASKVVVATVNGVDLEQRAYQQALSDHRRSLVQIMGRNVDAEYFSNPAFKLQVLESLIDSNLQAEYLRERGYRVTDEQLVSRIRSIEAFHSDGVFDTDRYETLVRNAGLSVEGFEQQQRQQGALEQLRTGLSETAFVMPAAIDRAIELLNQRRRASYTVLGVEKFSHSAAVGAAAVRAEFDNNPDRYVNPAEIQVDYLRLSVVDLAQQISVDEDSLKSYYDMNLAQFSRPGSRRASHILISVAADASADVVDAAQAQAAGLALRARAGENFEQLAREHSGDTGSAGRGGDLGVIRPGTMALPFEEAVFALDQGEVSEPVRTDYGWHVIRLTDLRENETKPFTEVRGEIRSVLAREAAEEQFLALAEDFQNIVFEQPGSLEPAADILGLPIERSEWFSRATGTGLTKSGVVRQAAFSDEVRVDRLNSEMLEVDSDTLVAVRYADFREQRKQAFEEVRQGIESELVAKAALHAQEVAAQALIDGLRSGANWHEALAEHQLESHELPQDPAKLSGPIEQGVAMAVFSSPVPSPGGATYGGRRLDSTRYIVFQLEEVILGNPTDAKPAERQQVENLIAARGGEELLSGLRHTLRSAAQVEVFEENL